MAFSDWSTTAGSNTTVGGVSLAEGMNPSDVNNAVRALMADGRAGLGTQSTIAAATTTDLGSVNASTLTLTGGAATITGLGTISAGVRRRVISNAAHVLQYNGTSLITPSAANITLASGDVFEAESLGSGNWRICFVEKISGKPIIPSLTLGTSQASTSGSSIDFTSIPAGTKQIIVSFVGVGTNGTAGIYLQIGDAGGLETSGYNGGYCINQTSQANAVAADATGFIFGVGSCTVYGSLTLTLVDASAFTWACSGNVWNGTAPVLMWNVAGTKALSAELTQVSVVSTDTFDAGLINIAYI